MLILSSQNGPMRINADYSTTANPYAWNKQVDSFWVDQPVYVYLFNSKPTSLTFVFTVGLGIRLWKTMALAKVGCCNQTILMFANKAY